MTAEDEMAEEVLSALHLNRSHPSKRPERIPDRHSLAPSALHTQNNPHCEMPVGKADKKFKQPQGTRVGGRVPETLGHRLIFSPSLPKYTPALFQQLSKVTFYSKGVFYSTILQILFHLLCSQQLSKLFFIFL